MMGTDEAGLKDQAAHIFYFRFLSSFALNFQIRIASSSSQWGSGSMEPSSLKSFWRPYLIGPRSSLLHIK
jgi:hypothetical protein